MVRSFRLAALWFLAALGLTVHAAEAAGPTVVKGGFATPESVLHWRKRDLYIVSNLNGSPLAKDGNGFLSLVSPQGVVLEPRWIDGATPGIELHAPKGMAMVRGQLWVTDIDVVRRFDPVTRKPSAPAIPIPGATFLNDLASTGEGGAWVSDMGVKAGAQGFEPSGTRGIWKIPAQGMPTPFFGPEGIDKPNGLARARGGVWCVDFGPGDVVGLSRIGRQVVRRKAPSGGLDGVEMLPGRRLAISSWSGQAVYLMDRAGNFTTLASDLVSPADLEYDRRRRRLVVPLFEKDELRFLPVP